MAAGRRLRRRLSSLPCPGEGAPPHKLRSRGGAGGQGEPDYWAVPGGSVLSQPLVGARCVAECRLLNGVGRRATTVAWASGEKTRPAVRAVDLPARVCGGCVEEEAKRRGGLS